MDRLLRILAIIAVLLLVFVLGGWVLRIIGSLFILALRLAIGLAVLVFIIWLISRFTRRS